MGFVLKKKEINSFLAAVMNKSKTTLIAPMSRDCAKFDTVKNKTDLKNLNFTDLPPFTAKKFFMPAYEQLYAYDRKKQKIIASPKKETGTQVIFGMRLCDLNAVKVQDDLFLHSDNPDTHYLQQRQRTILIGYFCDSIPSKNCFCSSMKLKNYYDLMFRDKGKYWYVDVGSDAGRDFVTPVAKKLKWKEGEEVIPPIETKKRLHTHDINRFYNHPKWDEVVQNECLSCERCTILCPTCMCFDAYDKSTDDQKQGVKERSWDSCHNVTFTRVAHEHYFRPSREGRFKHRIWHKVEYFPKVFGTPMCTGCGRCITHCPTTIDWVQIINDMHAEEKK